MQTRTDRYRQTAAAAKLRVTKTNDPVQKRAFEQAAHEWLNVADAVERMENSRLASSRGTRVRI
jgi:hypothetical protein